MGPKWPRLNFMTALMSKHQARFVLFLYKGVTYFWSKCIILHNGNPSPRIAKNLSKHTVPPTCIIASTVGAKWFWENDHGYFAALENTQHCLQNGETSPYLYPATWVCSLVGQPHADTMTRQWGFKFLEKWKRFLLCPGTAGLYFRHQPTFKEAEVFFCALL